MRILTFLALIVTIFTSTLFAYDLMSSSTERDLVCKADDVKIYVSGSGLLDKSSGSYKAAFNKAIIKDYDIKKNSFSVDLYYNDYSFWTKEGKQKLVLTQSEGSFPIKENTVAVKRLRHYERKIFIDILNTNEFNWEQDWMEPDLFGLDPNRYREEATGKCKPCSMYIFNSCMD